jgi:broad specificity phosphatase PhoE
MPPAPLHGGGLTMANGDDGGSGDPAQPGQQQQQHPPPPPLPPPPILALTVLPSRSVKTLHLVRHAEGFHNVAGVVDYSAYKRECFLDAHLTRVGWRQAHALRERLAAGGGEQQRQLHAADRPIRPAVVLTSPMARALETAVGAFGGPLLPFGHDEDEDDEDNAGDDGTPRQRRPQQQLLLMRGQRAEPGVREEHPPVSARGAPRFVAVEQAREHLGVHPCDRRRPLAGKRRAFPAVDFDAPHGAIAEEDDLWQPEHRETDAEIRDRAFELLRLVATARPEKELAIVSHSGLLRHMLAAAARDEGVRRPFDNAELRTVVLVVSP